MTHLITTLELRSIKHVIVKKHQLKCLGQSLLNLKQRYRNALGFKTATQCALLA